MSLLLFSAVGLTGMVLGRVAARYYAKRKEAAAAGGAAVAGAEDETGEKAKAPKKAAVNVVPKPNTPSLAGFPCQLEDVVMLRSGEEAWLCGAVVFSEEKQSASGSVAALFTGPDTEDNRLVFARRHSNSDEMVWLKKVAALPPYPGSEPPHVIELDSVRFEREKRMPVYTARLGADAPLFGDEVVLAEYHAATEERLVVVTGANRSHAFRGERLMAGMFDVLPGTPRDDV